MFISIHFACIFTFNCRHHGGATVYIVESFVTGQVAALVSNHCSFFTANNSFATSDEILFFSGEDFTASVIKVFILGAFAFLLSYQCPMFSADTHGSCGGSACPFCSNSIEILSGERINAM